jgi:protein TonB
MAMLLAAGHSWRPDAGRTRWCVAVATILLLHAGVAVGAMIRWESTEPPAMPPAAIMLELAPLPAAPPAPKIVAPQEPEPAPEPEAEPPVDLSQLVLPPIPEMPLTPPDIPAPEVELPKPELEKKAEEPKPEPEKKVEKPKEKPKEKPREEPKKEAVQKPKLEPRPEADPEPSIAQKSAPQQTQQAKAAAPVEASKVPAAPAASDVARRAAAEANWQGILYAHLERHKKYPRLARKRHEEGTAYLRVRMERSGQVLRYSLERSAGFEALDEEVLAMIERAQPLPQLPAEVDKPVIEFVVPVVFRLH